MGQSVQGRWLLCHYYAHVSGAHQLKILKFNNCVCRFSLVAWLLMNLMLVVVPRYGALLMTACGILLLATVCGYLGMLPVKPLVIHVEGHTVHFKLGWSFWLVFLSGKTHSHRSKMA